ncbi:DUF2933 domain-containing protein [Escherichia coli]|uniref:DUF2933 domain-containing protein n=1 Tax=Escherichia coli TaxID=562 RepID=UPI00399B8917
MKNDGHYFCRAGGNRPDGLNEPVTHVAGYWPYLLLLVCPLMHLFHGHGGHGDHQHHGSENDKKN